MVWYSYVFVVLFTLILSLKDAAVSQEMNSQAEGLERLIINRNQQLLPTCSPVINNSFVTCNISTTVPGDFSSIKITVYPCDANIGITLGFENASVSEEQRTQCPVRFNLDTVTILIVDVAVMRNENGTTVTIASRLIPEEATLFSQTTITLDNIATCPNGQAPLIPCGDTTPPTGPPFTTEDDNGSQQSTLWLPALVISLCASVLLYL